MQEEAAISSNPGQPQRWGSKEDRGSSVDSRRNVGPFFSGIVCNPHFERSLVKITVNSTCALSAIIHCWSVDMLVRDWLTQGGTTRCRSVYEPLQLALRAFLQQRSKDNTKR